MRRALTVARIQLLGDLRSPLHVTVLVLLAAFGFFVTSPANFMPGDYARAGEWWLAGQAFWMIGQYGSLAVFLLSVRATAGDRDGGRLEQQASTPLRSGEYLAGKALAASLLGLMPGLLLLLVLPPYRFAGVGHVDVWPYAAAFLGVYLPPIVLAAVSAVVIGAVLPDTRVGTVGYTAWWLASVFPAVFTESMIYLGITGSAVYAAMFELSDPGALASVPLEFRADAAASVARAAHAVPYNLGLYALVAGGLLLLASVRLGRRWDGTADGVW